MRLDTDISLTKAEEEQVWRTLEDLLHSPPLRATTQCQALLRYIVEYTLLGDPALLRERVIGKSVFGRPANYEPGEDPVVRIRVADLRKRLALYYQSLGETPEVRIEVPPGSYRATFTWHRGPEESAPALPETQPAIAVEQPAGYGLPEAETTEGAGVAAGASAPLRPAPAPAVDFPAPAKRKRARVWVLAVLAATVLAVAAVCGWVYFRSADPVRAFWEPMLADSRPVLISIGSNAVYRISDQRIEGYLDHNSAGQEGMEVFPAFAEGQTFGSTGLQAAPDSFVALGDVAAVSELVRLLTRYGKNFEERFPNDISFGEVREHATVLIGGSNNPTTRELTRGMPFQRHGRNLIVDRDHPGKEWVLNASSDSHDTEDYAIITRLAAKKDTAPLVSVAGLGGYGTLAATEFLCRADNVASLQHRLGAGWLKRNFQVLLRIKVNDFKPVTTDIVDVRSW